MKEFSLNLKTRLKSVYGRHNVEFMAAAVGMLVFILVYGYKILNPMNISWMYHGLSTDFTQHYLGWKGFRNSAWTFPIGLMDQLTYPDKVSIIYTDSIPIFALFFKLFNPILPDRFQYFGFWGILTYALNGVFASMILKRYLKSKLNVILGSLFFIFSFQMLERMYFHSALAAHWLILLPIYLILIRRELSLKKKIFLWGIVGALCPLIHSYFILFDGIILAGFMLAVIIDRDGMEDSNKKRLIAAGLSFLSFVLVGLFTLFILGAFDNTVADLNGSVDNFGLDLNAFFNEMGAGYFPEVFSYRKGHRIYYLGAGIIILTMITAIQIIRHKDWEFFKKRKNTIIAIAATYVLALIVACSPTITLNGNVIIHYPLPELVKNIWSVFKNTARTSWVCIYLIFIFAICADYKYVSRELKTSFL
ncbi:MAG: DUF6311 domain-containing protein, partial [Lachnospiraceae bacterium]|nr:DUF6311 domain-containing protein [Lachnospiraceae bacterium]